MSRAVVDVALATRRPIEEVKSWSLQEWATVLEVLNDGTV